MLPVRRAAAAPGRASSRAGETEEAFAARLSQVDDDVVVHEGEADAAASERGARASEARSAGDTHRGARCPTHPVDPTASCGGRPRPTRPRGPSSSPGEDHRHAGHRHLQTDADELTVARAGDGAEPRRVVAVEERPRVERRTSHGTPARNARIVADRCRAAEARHATGRLEVRGCRICRAATSRPAAEKPA